MFQVGAGPQLSSALGGKRTVQTLGLSLGILGLSLVRLWYISVPALLAVVVPTFVFLRRRRRGIPIAVATSVAIGLVAALLLANFLLVPLAYRWGELEFP